MAYESNSIFWVEIEKIVPNPFQPRREFDQAKLAELAESIRMYGVLQPLVVTRKEIIQEDGSFKSEYELIAGERRLRASKLADLKQVPVIIRSGEETELMKLELAIIENLQREDLNPIDRALAFRQLADNFGLSHAEVGKKVGRSREYVSNSIRLLQLPDTITGALRNGDISDGHARTLLMLNDRPEEQDVVFREILLKKLSVREVERITRKIATDKVRKKDWQNSNPELIELERKFTETLGTRVQIQKTEYGGKLTIDYFSSDDLNKLLTMMEAEQQSLATSDQEAMESIANSTPLTEDVESDRVMESDEVAAATPPPETTPTVEPEDRAEVNPAPAAAAPQSYVPAEPAVSEEPATPQSNENHSFEPAETNETPTMPEVPAPVVAQDTPAPEGPQEDVFVAPTAQAVATSEPPVEQEPEISQAAPETPKKEDASEPEDNLYSVRNFSI